MSCLFVSVVVNLFTVVRGGVRVTGSNAPGNEWDEIFQWVTDNSQFIININYHYG